MFILDICCPLSYPLLSRRGTRVFLSFLFVSRNLSFNGVNRFRQIGLAGMCLEFFSRTKKRHSGRDGTRAHRVGNTCSSTTYFSNGALYKLKANCFVVGEIVTVTIYFHFYIVLSVFLTIILSSKQKQKTIDYSIALLNGIAGRGISSMRY